jgi:hypothetical protein
MAKKRHEMAGGRAIEFGRVRASGRRVGPRQVVVFSEKDLFDGAILDLGMIFLAVEILF